jgi:hypothetical protein
MKLAHIVPHKLMELPDGTRLVLATGASCKASAESKEEELYLVNHNLFRLAADGSLIWQVRRDEQGRYDYEHHRRMAIEANKPDEPSNPFMWIDPDELGVRDVQFTGSLVPGSKVRVGSLVTTMPYSQSYQMDYDLDVETGVAINVTSRAPRRSW